MQDSIWLETSRLYLRSYEPGDAGWYYEMSLQNRDHLARYEAGNACTGIKTLADAEKVLRDFAAGWVDGRYFFMGAFLKGTSQFVAQIYIGTISRELPEYELGYFVDADYEGLGYVTEAVRTAIGFTFDHLGARRVRLWTDDTNERSWRVAERCGMLREGHLREDKRNPDGSITGTYCYGLLRSEYEARMAGRVGTPAGQSGLGPHQTKSPGRLCLPRRGSWRRSRIRNAGTPRR